MRKRIFFLWITYVTTTLFTNAQNNVAYNYSLSSSVGAYTPLVGATNVPSLIGTTEFISSAIPLNFTFTFNGIPYTSVYASPSGFLSFNPLANAVNSSINNLAVNSSLMPIIAPLWDSNYSLNYSNAKARYKTESTSQGNVFTFEWLNWKRPGAGSSASISFQVKLYETSGKIEFIYLPISSANTASASIGIAGANAGPGNYLSVTKTSAYKPEWISNPPTVYTSPLAKGSYETNTISDEIGEMQVGVVTVYTFIPENHNYIVLNSKYGKLINEADSSPSNYARMVAFDSLMRSIPEYSNITYEAGIYLTRGALDNYFDNSIRPLWTHWANKYWVAGFKVRSGWTISGAGWPNVSGIGGTIIKLMECNIGQFQKSVNPWVVYTNSDGSTIYSGRNQVFQVARQDTASGQLPSNITIKNLEIDCNYEGIKESIDETIKSIWGVNVKKGPNLTLEAIDLIGYQNLHVDNVKVIHSAAKHLIGTTYVTATGDTVIDFNNPWEGFILGCHTGTPAIPGVDSANASITNCLVTDFAHDYGYMSVITLDFFGK